LKNFLPLFPYLTTLFRETTEEYETPIYYEDWHNISPDGTLVIDRVDNLDFTYQYFLSNPQDLSPIVEIPAEFDPFNYYTLSLWSPDSQFFLASRLEGQEADGSYNVSLWLMNRNGEALYSIVDSLTLALFLHLDLDVKWSPDGRYLLILGNQNQIAWLIDLENRHSYNLCFDRVMSSAWSPDSQKLALQAYEWEDNSDTLTIFEPATWSWYEVADNPGAVPVGWQG
jgi:Tol biopolymer transport system component